MTHASLDTRARLVARSEPIADPGDLLDHLGPGGFAWLDADRGFVTAGAAAVALTGDTETVLAAVDHERAPGTPEAAGPRAVGALPFLGTAAGTMTVPALVVGRGRDGRAWRTTIDGTPVPTALRVAGRRPARFDVHAATGRDTWAHAVDEALAMIDAGTLDKVVLARPVDVVADAPFDISDTLAFLRASQPGCRVYADGGFLGASPEILVTRHGADVVSRPLAGTGDDEAGLIASAKDTHEHRIVVDAVTSALRDVCTDVRAGGPDAVRFGRVAHLATTVAARAPAGVSALALACMLHPTPAVGGAPTAGALATIARLEGFDRERYAGPCGWVDARGDGEFVVALRGGHLDGPHARLYAGAGIVAGSHADAEWVETQAKLEPMLRALVRP